jgi:Ribonuclease G/E
MQMLEDEEWSQWANRRIATACGVSEGLVRVMREDFNAKRKAREAAEAASASAYETQMRNAPVPDVVVKVKRGSQVYDMKHAPKPDKLKRVRYETCQVCSGTGRVKVEE